MRRSKPSVDYKTLHLTGHRIIRSQSSENISQKQYSFAKLTSNQSKIFFKYWQIYYRTSINGFNHTNCIIYISSKHKLVLTSASDTASPSTLQSSQNVKIEDSAVTQLSTMFNNCSIKETNIVEENKFEGIQQVAAQIATISDDIDDHIDENPIEEICNSIEDLDVIIMKTENLRTQYRSKYQESLQEINTKKHMNQAMKKNQH